MVAFKEGHLDLMDIREEEMKMFAGVDNWRVAITNMAEDSHAFTMLADGRPIACGGVFEIAPGIAYSWLLPTHYVDLHWKTFAVEVKNFFERMTETLGFYRFETSCPYTEVHSRWMKFLGFNKEGIKRQAGAGRIDMIMYARIV